MTALNDSTNTGLLARPAVHVFLLLLFSLVVMGYNLGSNSIHNDDEAKHAVVAREAALQGHWVPLTYKGRAYYSKPPLRIWLTALSFKVGEVNEWTVRLWSAIFGIGTVLALYLVGRRLWGKRIAFLSALILLTSHQYIFNHCVRTGETDSMLIFCWTCGLLLLQLAIQRGSRSLLLAAAAFVGLCGMVKHLGFIPIVLLIAVGYVLLAGAWRTFSPKIWLASLGMVVAVALPWHLLVWLKQGNIFLRAYFFGEIVEERLQAGPEPQIWDSPHQYVSLLTVARGFFPWSFLLPFALGDLVRSREFRRDWLLPLLWLLVALAATVISGRKYTWYVLPAFPAAAILVARLLDRFLGESRTWFVQAAVLLGGLAAFASVTTAATHNPFAVLARREMLSVSFLGRLRGPDVTFVTASTLFLLVAAVAFLTYWGLGRVGSGRDAQAIFRTAFVTALAGLGLYTVVVPLEFSRHRSTIDQMATATEQFQVEGEILQVALRERDTRNSRFLFYFGDKDYRRVDLEALAKEDLSGKLVLTSRSHLENLGIEASMDALAEAGEQVLLRWPER